MKRHQIKRRMLDAFTALTFCSCTSELPSAENVNEGLFLADEVVALPPLKRDMVRDFYVAIPPAPPKLASGSFLHRTEFLSSDLEIIPLSEERMDIQLEQPPPVTKGRFIHVTGPRFRIKRDDGSNALVDAHGWFVDSPDGSASTETVQRFSLPKDSIVPGQLWATSVGNPIFFTDEEIKKLDDLGAGRTKVVVDNSRVLETRTLNPTTKLLVVKRNLRAYVVPTVAAAHDAHEFQRVGISSYSPGMREQVGASYAYFAVSGSEAILVLEAAIVFGRIGELPNDVMTAFGPGASTEAFTTIRRIAPDESSFSAPIHRAAVEEALRSLPRAPLDLYADRLQGGEVRETVCSHCKSNPYSIPVIP